MKNVFQENKWQKIEKKNKKPAKTTEKEVTKETVNKEKKAEKK